jgi:hemolysin-activating ACP:hemolysin acyltransferase
MFKQVRVFTKGAQPLAALVWAYASPEVKERLDDKSYIMDLSDWRSGPEVVIVDCISPLTDGQMFIDQFMSQVKDAQKKNNNFPKVFKDA